MRIPRKFANILDRASGTLNALTRRSKVRNSLAKAGLLHANDIHTFTTKNELAALLELALQVPEGSDVVEVGSYIGASTCYIAAGLYGKTCRLTCIDTWQNETMPSGARDTMAEFEANLRPVAKMLNLLRKRTDEIDASILPKTTAFVFLDGDHSYEATKFDFQLIASRVEHNGVVVMHDILYFQGASRVLGEAIASGKWRLDGSCENLAWLRRVNFPHPDETEAV